MSTDNSQLPKKETPRVFAQLIEAGMESNVATDGGSIKIKSEIGLANIPPIVGPATFLQQRLCPF